MLERNRRLRKERQQAVILEQSSGAPTWRRLLTQVERVSIDAHSWFVIAIAGSLSFLFAAIPNNHLLQGAFIGVNAAIISIVTEWLSDLKLGYCSDGWWLNRNFCCWELDNSNYGCPNWHFWSPNSVGRWFVYVLCAVIFSYIAAHLVRVFARYAAGSGISEIKVILAGFVMKGYLGGWTLIIKSITLVCELVLLRMLRLTTTKLKAIRNCLRPLCWQRRPFRSRGLLHWLCRGQDV